VNGVTPKRRPAFLALLGGEARVVCKQAGLGAVFQAELVQHPGHIALDRRLGEKQPRRPSQWLAIALTLVLGAASFCALGVAVASVISNAEAAPAVAQLVLFPLLFLSGTYTPIHSQLLNRVTGWLPIRPFNEALTGPLARHTGPDWRHLAVLAAWGVVGALVAVRRFRWDPRPE
jgi:hypothetical protein